jgi:hypothetical protein
MPSHSEMAIEFEARRLWEASGRPIWSHPLDHWSEAIGSLAGRSAAQKARVPRYGPGKANSDWADVRQKRKELGSDA